MNSPITNTEARLIDTASQLRDPAGLTPWPSNARKHPDRQIKKLMASISKFGFTAPVLIDEQDVILAGHGRVQAALALGLALVPVKVISGLTEAKKRAYVLADNKLSSLSSWDEDKLREELTLLVSEELEIEATGFDTGEVDLILDGAVPTAPDKDDLHPEDLTAQPISQLGDLWQMGGHLLLCGNALEAADYTKLMRGDRAQLVVGDPPYNVPIDGHVCGNGAIKHAEFVMASGEMSSDEFTAFLRTVFRHVAAVCDDGALVFAAMDWRHMQEIQEAAKEPFGTLQQLCVWVKDSAGLGNFYRSQHELFFVFQRGKGPKINNFGLGQHGRYRTNCWQYPGINTFKGKENLLSMHPTVKPVALIADAIRDCSHRRGIVLDPFCGSGTILLAAERTGRRARALELEPKYVDVSVARWQRATRGQAILCETGETWAQVAARRHAVGGQS